MERPYGEQKTKTKNTTFLVFAPPRTVQKQKTEARFSFFFAFGGAKTKNAKFLAFFVFVFASIRSGLSQVKLMTCAGCITVDYCTGSGVGMIDSRRTEG